MTTSVTSLVALSVLLLAMVSCASGLSFYVGTTEEGGLSMDDVERIRAVCKNIQKRSAANPAQFRALCDRIMKRGAPESFPEEAADLQPAKRSYFLYPGF